MYAIQERRIKRLWAVHEWEREWHWLNLMEFNTLDDANEYLTNQKIKGKSNYEFRIVEIPNNYEF